MLDDVAEVDRRTCCDCGQKLRIRKVTKRTGRGAAAGHRERVARRQADTMRLRVAGASLSQIARQLGVSKQQSFRDSRAALTETLELRDGDAARYRELECARLDALLVSIWPRAQKGDVEAVRAAVRISESRRRLLGLDAEVSARLDVRGAVVVDHDRWTPIDAYARLNVREIADRIEIARENIRALVESERPEVEVETVVEAEPLTVEERYEQVLRDRRRD